MNSFSYRKRYPPAVGKVKKINAYWVFGRDSIPLKIPRVIITHIWTTIANRFSLLVLVFVWTFCDSKIMLG
jgi:hypothetical protein